MGHPVPFVEADPRFPGLYRGAVSDVDDTTHRGRIKVTVPAVFDESTPDAAVWATPCFPWGHVFVPEVGDKVWVAFEDGDPSAPVWLGAWYPTNGTPSDAAVSPPVKRLIRSHSGHQILLDDTSGSEKVVITDQGGCSIEMSSSGITIEAPGKTILLKGSSVDVQSA